MARPVLVIGRGRAVAIPKAVITAAVFVEEDVSGFPRAVDDASTVRVVERGHCRRSRRGVRSRSDRARGYATEPPARNAYEYTVSPSRAKR